MVLPWGLQFAESNHFQTTFSCLHAPLSSTSSLNLKKFFILISPGFFLVSSLPGRPLWILSEPSPVLPQCPPPLTFLLALVVRVIFSPDSPPAALATLVGAGCLPGLQPWSDPSVSWQDLSPGHGDRGLFCCHLHGCQLRSARVVIESGC